MIPMHNPAGHAHVLPARTKADLADPAGSLDPSDQIWSQWRSEALIAEGPAKITRFVLDATGALPQDLLEVGCGSGYLALELARAGHRVIAVDPSDEAWCRSWPIWSACASRRGPFRRSATGSSAR